MDLPGQPDQSYLLVVDDELFFRDLLRDTLGSAGYPVVVAADAETALDICRQRLPLLAILDIHLPGTDGTSLCRTLRAMPGGDLLPILILTAFGDDAHIHMAFESGASDFITKPFSAEVLVERIRFQLRNAANVRELTASREQLLLMRSALDSLPVGITIADPQGIIVYANRAESALHGYQSSELLGRPAHSLGACGHPPSVPPLPLAERDAWQRESSNSHRDGSIFPVRLSSATVRNDQGSVVGTVTASEDLRPLRQMESALTRQQEELRLLFDKSLDGLFFMILDEPVLWDAECDHEAAIDFVLAHQRLTRANQALLDQYGASEAELLGTPYGDFFAHDPQQARQAIRTLFDCGQARIATEERRRDGTPFFCEGYYVCLYDDHGRIVGKFGAQRDVTQRRQVEQQLLESKRIAEAAVRAKSAFLANTSHELRTPLNGLLGMLQLLQTTSLDQEQREYADLAVFSGNSLLEVINDILEFSKLEAGKVENVRIEMNLYQLVENVATIFGRQSLAKGVSIDWQFNPSVPPQLLGDPGRLRQILFNLVGNAVKFTDKGNILIHAECCPRNDGSTVLRIAVRDTGIGIDPALLARIFEPFTQGDQSHTRRHQGTGLGLAIVSRLLHHLGGTIAIESAPGQGTNVVIDYPVFLSQEDSVSITELDAPTPAANAALSLLVVEDNPVNRRLLQKQLERLGHRVLCADGGTSALELLTTETPDAVLLDIQMPDMDGLEVLRRLRMGNDDRYPRGLPLIAVTAHALSGDRERFLAAGFNAYLAKPIRLPELENALVNCALSRTQGNIQGSSREEQTNDLPPSPALN